MPMAWRDLAYLRTKWRGLAVAPVLAAERPEPAPLAPLPPETEPAPVPALNGQSRREDAGLFPWSGAR